MKSVVFSLLVLFVMSTSSLSTNKRKLRYALRKMHLISSDYIYSGLAEFNKINSIDSNLIWPINLSKQFVNSFYISATEVTNKEWLEFYNSKVKELGENIARKKYLPDTTNWETEFKYSYVKTLTDHYHRDKIFANHPIVSITYNQAEEYCKWLTKSLDSIGKQNGINLGIEFRLPTMYEWELAARIKNSDLKLKNLYPWGGTELKLDNKYCANFGKIYDSNYVLIKDFAGNGDEGLFTCDVGNHVPNDNGLYDMAGNAAEWVLDSITRESKTQLNSEIIKFKELLKSNDSLKYSKTYFDMLLHNKEVYKRKDLKIIKGGSFYDGLAYMQIGSSQVMNANESSCKVGFRIVATLSDERNKEYFPSKYWKSETKK